MRKKIIYKGSDYKFGRPVGYGNEEELSGETPHIYFDKEFEHPFTSEDIKKFFRNDGLFIVPVDSAGDVELSLTAINYDSTGCVLIVPYVGSESSSSVVIYPVDPVEE